MDDARADTPDVLLRDYTQRLRANPWEHDPVVAVSPVHCKGRCRVVWVVLDGPYILC